MPTYQHSNISNALKVLPKQDMWPGSMMMHNTDVFCLVETGEGLILHLLQHYCT